jgi:hypothetical protein
MASAPNRHDESDRTVKLGALIVDALERPLTAPGSEKLAALVLQACGSQREWLPLFVKKCLQTLDDGNPHSMGLVSPRQDFVGSFVAWHGTHREVQLERVGKYLGSLFATANKFVQMGLQPIGFLEIDAYVRKSADLAVDIEYSYLPSFAFGGTAPVDDPRFRVIQINPSLCTTEEKQVLRQLASR